MDLTVYRWRNRLLMLFSSSPDDSNYQSFMKEAQDQRNGLRDRDIWLSEILENGESRSGNSPLKRNSAGFEQWLEVDQYPFPKSLLFRWVRERLGKEVGATSWEEEHVRFRETSPIHFAARIEAPVLLIHGEGGRAKVTGGEVLWPSEEMFLPFACRGASRISRNPYTTIEFTGGYI
jgi:hypothetical protein